MSWDRNTSLSGPLSSLLTSVPWTLSVKGIHGGLRLTGYFAEMKVSLNNCISVAMHVLVFSLTLLEHLGNLLPLCSVWLKFSAHFLFIFCVLERAILIFYAFLRHLLTLKISLNFLVGKIEKKNQSHLLCLVFVRNQQDHCKTPNSSRVL